MFPLFLRTPSASARNFPGILGRPYTGSSAKRSGKVFYDTLSSAPLLFCNSCGLWQRPWQGETQNRDRSIRHHRRAESQEGIRLRRMESEKTPLFPATFYPRGTPKGDWDNTRNQTGNLPETRPRDIQLGYLGLIQKEVVNETRNCSETDTGSITDMTIELTGEETRNYDRQIPENYHPTASPLFPDTLLLLSKECSWQKTEESMEDMRNGQRTSPV